MSDRTDLYCRCGKVHLELQAAPITVAECHCNSCRSAAAYLATLPDARPVAEANGGTQFVLQRKDRMRVVSGIEHLAAFRLKPDSLTRRVVATCCNTPVFLEFQHGHWLSLYSGLWPAAQRPAIQSRTMIGDLPAGTVLPDDVPNHKSQSGSFFIKLLLAWAAMGFRGPKIAIDRQLAA